MRQLADAQILVSSTYLCLIGTAILNITGDQRLLPYINRLVNETRGIVKGLSLRVGEMSKDPEVLSSYLSGFLSEASIDEKTNINGLAGFEAVYISCGEQVMQRIIENRDGPTGPVDHASFVSIDALFGKGSLKEYFFEILECFSKYVKQFSKAL